MPSHFTSLGLEINSKEIFFEYYNRAQREGQCVLTPKGSYHVLKMGSGVELWGQSDHQENPLGMNPAFLGNSRMRIRIESVIRRDAGTSMDGALYAWADPDEKGKGGAYPFVFDLPNFSLVEDLSIPQVVDAQISAIAHEVEIFANEDAYFAAQSDEVKFAVESFIPSGMMETGAGEHEAMAMFSGTVMACETRQNDLTQNPFVWAKVKTLGGEIDVIMDMTFATPDLVVGSIVRGTFWLSGRILGSFNRGEVKNQKFSFKKLFGSR